MTSGALLFARFAYPPNVLGYCGPDASRELVERAQAGPVDADLRRLVTGFEGAWPYLQLIAAANGVADPLDAAVVEAYWIGNALLEGVPPGLMHRSMEERFRGRAGSTWPRLEAGTSAQARAHHSFHVFAIYPWVGLLRSGVRDEPLFVLDRCRIRWGRVERVDGERVLVRSRGLTWDGRRLALGPHRLETAQRSQDGLALTHDLQAGDWCALHWDWVCDRLTPNQLRTLVDYTHRQLAMVNAASVPAPAAVLA